MIGANPLLPHRISDGFWVGSISGFVAAGTVNAMAVKEGTKPQETALRETVKRSLQGGIALGAAVEATDRLQAGNWLGALGVTAMGVAAFFAVEKIDEKLTNNEETIHAEQ